MQKIVPSKPFRLFTYCLMAVILFAMLAGCGRKGGLYLPENVKQEQTKDQPDTADQPDDAGS